MTNRTTQLFRKHPTLGFQGHKSCSWSTNLFDCIKTNMAIYYCGGGAAVWPCGLCSIDGVQKNSSQSRRLTADGWSNGSLMRRILMTSPPLTHTSRDDTRLALSPVCWKARRGTSIFCTHATRAWRDWKLGRGAPLCPRHEISDTRVPGIISKTHNVGGANCVFLSSDLALRFALGQHID